VICRIFHKSGEKRNSLLQIQGHLGGNPNLTPQKTCLPPTPPLLATSFTQLDQNDQLLSHSHNIFPLPTFQPSFSMINHTTRNNNNNPSSELLFKSQQNYTMKQTIPKTEATFYDQHQSQSQSIDDALNLRWIIDNNNNNYQNSLFPVEMEMDAAHDLIAFSGAATNAEFRDMTIINSRGAGLDVPMGIDSWPHAQLV